MGCVKRLQNKKILITAGPTWAAIDSVRVISNTASGETGILLADVLRRAGARVTLVLGPGADAGRNKNIRVIRFSFFDELKKIIETELNTRGYDAIVHSAAVSDYAPARAAKGKLSSAAPRLKLTLIRTPKIIDIIRRKAPSALLIGFKFLPDAAPQPLIARARELGRHSRANLIVANTVRKGAYRAFVVAPQGIVPEAVSKHELAELLLMYLEAFFSKKPAGASRCSCGNC
jgi:phosphopantothenoylcysteine decarboxylase / phosphopantothenate---cysteine ligase